ncbi:MAG: hypothetical protein ACRDY0_02495 [Acidimicrobiales bacterium]
MAAYLIVTDSARIYDEVASVLGGPGSTLRWIRAGAGAREALEAQPADLAVLDSQIGSMGGIAVHLDIRLESDAGRLDRCPTLLLLDRRADVFMARRAGVEGWLVKPLDPIGVRRAAAAVIGGQGWHDPSYAPTAVG